MDSGVGWMKGLEKNREIKERLGYEFRKGLLKR